LILVYQYIKILIYIYKLKIITTIITITTTIMILIIILIIILLLIIILIILILILLLIIIKNYIYILCILYYIPLDTSKKQRISPALRSSKVKAGISSVPFLRKLSSQDVGVTGILPGEVGDVLQDTGGLSEDCGWGWASRGTLFITWDTCTAKRHELDDFVQKVGFHTIPPAFQNFPDAKLGTSLDPGRGQPSESSESSKSLHGNVRCGGPSGCQGPGWAWVGGVFPRKTVSSMGYSWHDGNIHGIMDDHGNIHGIF
jgi:hypothetical protein